MIVYEAFIESERGPEAPCAEGPRVLFQSPVRRVQGPNALQRSNAFTSAFKELEPIPQFK